MTGIIIDDTVPYTQSIATTNQTQFDTDWTADAAVDVVVYARADGVEPDDVTQLISPSLYNVTFVGAEEFVRVTFLSGRANLDVVTITRSTPIDRENLYINTNFTPSMLNSDFGLFTLQMQERDLYNTQLTPRYNTSATVEPVVDTILPILGARQGWRKNAANDAIEVYDLPDGDIAPADQTYVTITDETASLPNSVPLSAVAQGILINLPGTGFTAREVVGTANRITVADGDGVAGDITLDIAANPVLAGTAGMGIPAGTTGQRVVPTPPSIGLRYNTDLGQMEFYAGGTWNQLEDSTDIATLLAMLASHANGEGASLIGLQTPSTSTVQDLSEAEFYVNSPSDALPNAIQFDPADYLPLAGGTMAGDISLDDAYRVTNALDPLNPQDYATKNYVDQTALSGTSVFAATTATLNATQAGAGVGATLTDASGTFAAFTTDGTSPSVGDDILNKDQTDAEHQGIYTLTTNGNGVDVPWVLTRKTGYDTPTEINNTGLIVVRNGTTLEGTAWYNADTIVTVDTTPFDFAPFGNSGSVTSIAAGTGIAATPDPITTTGTIAVSGALAEISTNVIGVNKNLVIGGNFDTNPWQRGTSFTAPATTTYTADRFSWVTVGAGVVNILKTADAPTVAESGIFSSNCFHVDVTTADGSLAATDIYRATYKIEGYDWAQIAQRAFTISFWVKSTKTGIFSVAFQNSGADRSYVAEYTVDTTDTWEKKTITVSASPSAGTWLYTNGVGLVVTWIIAAGSNFTTSTLDTWNSDALIASSNQVNGMDADTNNFKLQLIQIEAGSNATGFQVRSVETELALCQRYYEKTFNQGTTPAVGAGSGGALSNTTVATSTPSASNWLYKVNKRAVPTITYYGLATTTLWRNQSDGTDSGASSLAGQGVAACTVQNAGSGTDEAGDTVSIHATADAEL